MVVVSDSATAYLYPEDAVGIHLGNIDLGSNGVTTEEKCKTKTIPCFKPNWCLACS
jgi:hypothetical protein